MAVQAQHPSNAFSPDFRSRAQNNALEELQMLQGRDNNIGNLFFGGYSNLGGAHVVNNGTVFSDPQSELTCNASGSRKRNREESMALPQPNQNQHQMPLQFRYPNPASFPVKSVADPSVSTGVQISRDQTRLFESAGTSTSGRPSTLSAASSAVVSPVAQEIISHFYQQNLEIDALIRLQTERLRSGLEETRKRHCRALVSVLEQQVVKRLKEKEAELEHVSRRNAELEEKIRQMSQENQVWFNLAKNNEAIVSSLRTSLEQVLFQNAVTAAGVKVKEGYGDSDGTPFPVDDAQSCCFEEEEKVKVEPAASTAKDNEDRRSRKVCKVCGENDVSILMLPCRHLCLCKDCESKVATCPICQTTKNACLQIFML